MERCGIDGGRGVFFRTRRLRRCFIRRPLTRQLDPDTYSSVIGNCGTLLSCRVGLEDAELLAPAMSKHPGELTPGDLCNLPNYTAYVRLLVDGFPSRPFSMRTLPPDAMAVEEQRADIVRRASRHRYGRPALAMVRKSFSDEESLTEIARMAQ